VRRGAAEDDLIEVLDLKAGDLVLRIATDETRWLGASHSLQVSKNCRFGPKRFGSAQSSRKGIFAGSVRPPQDYLHWFSFPAG
jgi:hypothetical protein